MKKIFTTYATIILLFTAQGVSAAPITSENFAFDASAAFASGPGSFDSGVGFNIGAGYMLTTITKNLQARIDIGYYYFERDDSDNNLSYWRAPLTISARYYFPLMDQLRVFGQFGVETSWDVFESRDLQSPGSRRG